MEWFRQAFDQSYLLLYAHRDGTEARQQVSFALRALALGPGDIVLDLACGAGRHAVEFARRGIRTVALDLSPHLIRTAGEVLRGTSVPALPVRADMRRLPLNGSVDGAVSIFTSFGYFRQTQEDQRVLREVYVALKPGRRFLLDVANPSYLRRTLRPFDERVVNNARIRQWRWFNPGTRRVEKLVLLSENGYKRRLRESVRCYTREELEQMFVEEGFQIIGIYGDFHGSPWRLSSPRTVIIAEKPQRQR